MSDLISRSELIKRFCINKDGHRIPERDCDNFEVTVSVKDVKTIIKEQPTAYNIDKVVDELEERTDFLNGCTKYGNKDAKQQTESYSTMMMYEVADLVDDLIEIVKQGSVSEEVCEWHRVKNGNAYRCNTHSEIYDSRVLDWCKCPYCGKKIKIVGD